MLRCIRCRLRWCGRAPVKRADVCALLLSGSPLTVGRVRGFAVAFQSPGSWRPLRPVFGGRNRCGGLAAARGAVMDSARCSRRLGCRLC